MLWFLENGQGQELRVKLPLDARAWIGDSRAMLRRFENQFSLTHAALSTSGQAKSKFSSQPWSRCMSGLDDH